MSEAARGHGVAHPGSTPVIDTNRSGAPDLSIVIVNRNTRDFLARCLQSIEEHPPGVATEVIVVDNGSSDGSADLVRELYPEVRLIRNEENTGFAFPNNQGMRVAGGRYVMLLNSDTVVLSGALQRLVHFMDEHPDVGASGPRLSFPDGRLQPSCFSFHTPWRLFCDMSGLASLFPRSRIFGNQQVGFDYHRSGPAEALMGAAIVVRRSVLESVGLIDETFTLHANEVDWCYRMHLAGWERVFVHDAEIIHEMGGTMRQENVNSRLQGEMLQNLFDYYRKYYGVAGVLWFRLCSALGYGARMLWYPIRNRARPSAEGRRLAKLAPGMVRAAIFGRGSAFSAANERGSVE